MNMNPSEAMAKELNRRRYSKRTIQTYVGCLERFLRGCKKDVKKITKKDIRVYLEKMSDKNRAGNTMNVTLMALKFYFEQIQEKRMWINIKYSKIPQKIQRFLTREEVSKLLNAISNWKHRLMIEFIYGSGLRVSELLNIKIKDLNLDKDYGFVRNGKGGKDRLIVLSKIVSEKIKNLIELENLALNGYLFVSNRGRKYSVRSIQKIIKNACKKCGIEKKVHPHTLRHSFATQLVENGYDISQVQAMLGHKSPETTMVYTHIASPKLVNIKSPLDD